MTPGSPKGLMRQDVAATASPRVTLTGGHVNAKSNVNLYVLGEQAQISSPITCPPALVSNANKIPMNASLEGNEGG
jgi:hypothetical protein